MFMSTAVVATSESATESEVLDIVSKTFGTIVTLDVARCYFVRLLSSDYSLTSWSLRSKFKPV
jgi:hypothetical protein